MNWPNATNATEFLVYKSVKTTLQGLRPRNHDVKNNNKSVKAVGQIVTPRCRRQKGGRHNLTANRQTAVSAINTIFQDSEKINFSLILFSIVNLKLRGLNLSGQ